MMRLAIAFVLVGACSGNSKPGTQAAGAGSGSGSAILAKRMLLSWGVQQHASAADIFLQTTDETGKQVSHPLGTFAGQCAESKPADDMKAVIGVACKDGATGIELHAVVRDNDIIVLEMRVDEGVTPDPMAREEVIRIKAPLGAAIGAG